ncbi:MAG: diguanylate cyclase [Burkholderiaceae bacterium]|nr:diguanylate cyclase [Burkholderiaceae bacterium]
MQRVLGIVGLNTSGAPSLLQMDESGAISRRGVAAAEAAAVPAPSPVPAPALPPQLRRVFLREPPAFPAWLLIFVLGDAGARLGRAEGWSWVAAAGGIALIRALIAIRALSPRRAPGTDSELAALFVSTHLTQALLWVLLLGGPSTPGASMRGAVGLIFAMGLSSACLRGWRRGWLIAMGGWVAAALATAAALWGSQPAVCVALLVLMPIIAWAGLGPGKPATKAAPATTKTRTSMPVATASGGSTRRGMQLAIHASSTPMIGVYDGRIFEVNRSAEVFLGRAAQQCIGRAAAELLVLDPPSALDAAYPAAERHALVAPVLNGHANGAAPPAPAPARIRVGRAGGQAAVAVVALAPNSELVADFELHTGLSRRVLGQLPALIWLIDGDGRVAQAHASDVGRWGIRTEPSLRPPWANALALQPDSQDAFERAVARARQGKATYDLLNYRTGRSGGKLALRTHFVPLQPPGAQGIGAVMVMDTIASVSELLEVERLRASKAQYKDLVEASPNLIWACDSAFRFTFASRRACRDVYDRAVEEIVGQPLSVLLDPQADQSATRQALLGLRSGKPLRDFEMAHIGKDGRHITAAVSAVALRSSDGGFAGAIGINVDVSTLKQREARLAEALRVERSVLDSTGQPIAVVKDGSVARCNDAFLHLLQMTPQQLAQAPVADLFAERSYWNEATGAAERAAASDGAVTREMRVRRAAGAGGGDRTVWCQVTVRAIGPREYVIALADIDLIRRREAHAHHDARHDELTGLPNRRLLSERVRAALATSALRNSGCAILVFDLDGFKPINDRFGHAAGDLVLREIAQRLRAIVRPQDTVARIGGDEFALLMPDCGSVQDVRRIAQRIIRELAQPLALAASDLGGAHLTASLGVVMAPEHGDEPQWLMRLADRAMYDAKMEGGNRVVFSAGGAFADELAQRA